MTLRAEMDLVSTVATGGLIQVRATDSDCMALAADLNLTEVLMLEASITARVWRKEGFALVVQGRVDVTQTCIVSLDPVPETIELSFERRYLPAEQGDDLQETRVELELDYEAEDPPETLEGQVLSLYEVIREELSLSLNPYPRKDGVALPDQPNSDDKYAGKESPFAALEGWKSKSD